MHGLGNRHIVHELENFIRAQDPTALFLAETWVGEARLVSLCAELGFDHHWITPKINRLGCLALFWKNSLKIEVISSSPNHIDAVIGGSLENKWRLTSIYGFADPAKKCNTWALLGRLHRNLSLPWLCTEDFNEILWSHEKCGLSPRGESLIKDFRDVLDEAGLKDLGLHGEEIHLERPSAWWLCS